MIVQIRTKFYLSLPPKDAHLTAGWRWIEMYWARKWFWPMRFFRDLSIRFNHLPRWSTKKTQEAYWNQPETLWMSSRAVEVRKGFRLKDVREILRRFQKLSGIKKPRIAAERPMEPISNLLKPFKGLLKHLGNSHGIFWKPWKAPSRVKFPWISLEIS